LGRLQRADRRLGTEDLQKRREWVLGRRRQASGRSFGRAEVCRGARVDYLAPAVLNSELGGACSNVSVSLSPASVALYVALNEAVSASCNDWVSAESLFADEETVPPAEAVVEVVPADDPELESAVVAEGEVLELQAARANDVIAAASEADTLCRKRPDRAFIVTSSQRASL